ncbi:hypothetical protein EK21DRAFT_99415 [Setomelanomma holmii]|uniref:Uncharacterized protein n=1 Tax=Setomelanomma holmii TaxID=210430 RepID=A0A9P4HBF9_9PLEO|nr:hypothetical protein EK21DRAFT_99415 [Setomelanomma holmii]
MGEFIPTDGVIAHQIPRLERIAGGHQLVVHDEPFLMLPADLPKSSFSCPNFMKQDIEPEEGNFDFTRLEQALLDARVNGFHVALLWFGALKNEKSTYAPRWVKTSPKRFPRMMTRTSNGGTKVEDVLSILNPAVVNGDAAAFKTLMQDLRESDQAHSTVLMVQVENEVSLLGDSRDAPPRADAHFNAPVPAELIEMIQTKWSSLHESLKKNLSIFRQEFHLLKTGTHSWLQTFGHGRTTDEVARVGKAEYPLPMFINSVVGGGGGQPGNYPSGGGVINVLDIWHHFAPALDFVAPDLYLNDYNAICANAYGTHGALGTAPFAIDSWDAAEIPWPRHFGLLKEVAPWLLAARESNSDTFGSWFDEPSERVDTVNAHRIVMNFWNLTIERSFVFGEQGPGYGMIIHLSESKFLLVSEGFHVRFGCTRKDSSFVGILSEMVTGRVLNGDETRTGELAIMPAQKPDLGTFPICIAIPSRSRIAEVEVCCSEQSFSISPSLPSQRRFNVNSSPATLTALKPGVVLKASEFMSGNTRDYHEVSNGMSRVQDHKS